MALTKHITKAMVDAAYRVLAVECMMPYGASVTNYTDPVTGTVDREALRKADLEAELRNKALVRRALLAAAFAGSDVGRPRKNP